MLGLWQSWSLALLWCQWGYWTVDEVEDAMSEAGKGTKAEVLTQSICWCSQLGCSFAYSFTVVRGREVAEV